MNTLVILVTKNWSVGGKLNSYSLKRSQLRPKPKTPSKKFYEASPNNDQLINYNDIHWRNPVSLADYSQHRQQDRGRAIALRRDPKYSFINRESESVWNFKKIGKFRAVQYYQVLWNGIGTPSAGKTVGSRYSNGFDYYDPFDNTFLYHVDGRPDCFTWAVWFMVNGIPSDSLWIPTPSRNPSWTFAPAWVEY